MTPLPLSIIGIVIAAIAAILWMIAPSKPSSAMRARLKGLKFAHRGLYDNGGPAPENSMKAFLAAVDAGYGIELDVRLTKDGRVVVFHDGSLTRMCGLDKPVEALTLAELEGLHLLGAEERIPEFGGFLSSIGGRTPLLIEFKTGLPGGSVAEPLCEAAMALLDGYEGPYVIESFDYLVLEWFRKNRPGVMRGQLGMGLRCYEPAMGKRAAAMVPAYRKAMLSWLLYNHRGRPHFISYRFQDAGFALALCRALGAPASAWTVKTHEEGERLTRTWDAIIFEGYLA